MKADGGDKGGRGDRRRQGREREWDERRFTERLGDPPAPVT